MKAILPKKELAAAANQMKIALVDSSIHALKYVQIDAKSGYVKLSATNLVTSLQALVETPFVEVPGLACVQGKSFIDIVNSVPGESVTVESFSPSQLLISGGNSRFKLNMIPADDFPMLPNPGSDFISLPGAYFIDLFSRTLFAAHTDPVRPAFNGIYLDPAYVACTDGHRLVFVSPHQAPVKRGIVIPAKPLREVASLFSAKSIVEFSYGEREVHFRFDNRLATIRLIEERYPDVRPVIPVAAHHEAKLSRKGLIEALERAALLMSGTRSVNLSFGKNVVEITASGDNGEAQEIVEAQNHKELVMRFDCNYLIQSLNHLKGGEVTLELRESKSPLVIREGELLHVIMPRSQ